MTTPALVTFGGPEAAAPNLTADHADRTVSGLIVPFGPEGRTHVGMLRFSPGSLTWSSDVRRVKLLREHDQTQSLGHAVELSERPEGIYGTFRVPAGPAGDQVLADVDEGIRDGFSVGVMLDAATETNLRRAQSGHVVAGRGVIRETSMVSVPAFDDARASRGRGVPVAASNGALTTMTSPTPGTVPPPVPTPPVTEPANPPAEPADPAEPTTPVARASAVTTGQATGPVSVRAAAGAVTVLSEPATYTLDGQGPSLVRDAFLARVEGDTAAADRVRRFNAELRGGNAQAINALTRAAAGSMATFAPIPSPADTSDVNIPTAFFPNANRADLFREAVNAGRPLISRLEAAGAVVRIDSAQPFLVPFEGEFDGVADHVEGTPHAAEGTLTLSDAPVTPRAVSGAYRVTRELVDASNPVIDRIALRAMLRDYRRVSEDKMVLALASVAPTVGAVDTAMEMRALAEGFVDDDGIGADFIAASTGVMSALLADVDTTGRPMLSTNGTAPTAGRMAGYSGLDIDGIPIVRTPRITTGKGYAIRAEGVLFAESPVQQFRFDEVEGPGLIKLALWAYVAAAILDPSDVVAFQVAALGG